MHTTLSAFGGYITKVPCEHDDSHYHVKPRQHPTVVKSDTSSGSGASTGIGVGAALAILCTAAILFFLLRQRRQADRRCQMRSGNDQGNGQSTEISTTRPASSNELISLEAPNSKYETSANRPTHEVGSTGAIPAFEPMQTSRMSQRFSDGLVELYIPGAAHEAKAELLYGGVGIP